MEQAWGCPNRHLKIGAEDLVQRVELGQTNIMFNISHQSISAPHHGKTDNTLLLLIQEI
jgi:hypothetical protein